MDDCENSSLMHQKSSLDAKRKEEANKFILIPLQQANTYFERDVDIFRIINEREHFSYCYWHPSANGKGK